MPAEAGPSSPRRIAVLFYLLSVSYRRVSLFRYQTDGPGAARHTDDKVCDDKV